MAATKKKVSITLSSDVLAAIDGEVAASAGATRSSVVQAWLERAARQRQAEALREQTIAYYEQLTAAEEDEDAAIARASSRAARKLDVD